MFLCASYMRMLIVKAEPGVSELRLCTALGRWTVRCLGRCADYSLHSVCGGIV